MAEQKHKIQARREPSDRQVVSVATVQEEQKAPLVEWSARPAIGAGSTESQARWLNGGQLHGAQQHALAAQIGKTLGNRHLQRVIASAGSDKRTAPHQPSAPRSARQPAPSSGTAATRASTTAELPASDLASTEMSDGLGVSGPPTAAAASMPPPETNEGSRSSTVHRSTIEAEEVRNALHIHPGWDAVGASRKSPETVTSPAQVRERSRHVDPAPDRAAGLPGGGASRVQRLSLTGAVSSIVSSVSPELAAIIRRGPVQVVLEKLQSGIRSWVRSVSRSLGLEAIVASVRNVYTSAFQLIGGVLGGDPGACHQLADTLNAVRQLGQALMNHAAVQRLRQGLDRVKAFVRKIASLVLAPTFDVLKSIAGAAWNGVRAVAGVVQRGISAVRRVSSRAWDWVSRQLGLGGEGGIIDWIQSKASAAWDRLKRTLAPLAGPLRVVGGALIAFSPVGMFLIYKRVVPPLIESARWLWSHRGDPNIVQNAHRQMGHTVLPRILSGLQRLGQALRSTASSFTNKVTALSRGVLRLLGAITGIPLLQAAQSLVQSVSSGIQRLVEWGTRVLVKVAGDVQRLFGRVRARVAPYIEVLSSLALAVTNPPMIPLILSGWAWRALPNDCKPPIINFLLDIIIRAVRAVPTLPTFGVLWPLIKPGVVGFLETMRTRSDAVKIAISNKMAKIISGASPAFMIGFIKGLLQGIWEGISDPFKLAFAAIEGLSKVVTWLQGMAQQGSGESRPAAATATPTTPASAEQPGSAPIADIASLGQRMGEMAGELQPPVDEVKQGFMPAVKEVFSSGGGTSFDDLAKKLGEVWASAERAIRGQGQTLAEKTCAFLLSSQAEGTIGEKVGWLAGTIIFEVVLAVLTAGSWTAASGAMKVLKLFAKVLDWTGEALGLAFRAISRVGRFILKGLKGLRKLLSRAGGAVGRVLSALGEIGRKLIDFARELLGRARRGAAGGAERASKEAAGEAAEKFGRETAEAGGEKAGREAAQESADKFSREGLEEGAAKGRKADEAAPGRKEGGPDVSERARAIAEAKVIAFGFERVHAPVSALMAGLSVLKTKYRWIDQFKSEFKRPGHYRVVMREVIDDDYEATAKATTEAGERGAKEATGEISDRELAQIGEEFGQEASELVAKHGEDGRQVLRMYGRDGVDVLRVYDYIEDVPNAKQLLDDVLALESTAQGALSELGYAASLKRQGFEIEKVGDVIGGKKAGDILIKDGPVIDVKDYRWDSWYYQHHGNVEKTKRSLTKQVERHRERYPGRPIEYAFTDLDAAPMPIKEALEDLGVRVTQVTWLVDV